MILSRSLFVKRAADAQGVGQNYILAEEKVSLYSINRDDFATYIQLLYTGEIVLGVEEDDEPGALSKFFRLVQQLEDRESRDLVLNEAAALLRRGDFALEVLNTVYDNMATAFAPLRSVVISYIKERHNAASLKAAMSAGQERHLSLHFLKDMLLAFARFKGDGEAVMED